PPLVGLSLEDALDEGPRRGHVRIRYLLVGQSTCVSKPQRRHSVALRIEHLEPFHAGIRRDRLDERVQDSAIMALDGARNAVGECDRTHRLQVIPLLADDLVGYDAPGLL